MTGWGYCNYHTAPNPPYCNQWPGDNGKWPMVDALIEFYAQRITELTAKYGGSVEWDVWSEPNDGPDLWQRSMPQFLATWAHIRNKIKSVMPNATVIGPSVNEFDAQFYTPNYKPAPTGQFLQTFLKFAKKTDTLPDVLSWHELGPPPVMILRRTFVD